MRPEEHTILLREIDALAYDLVSPPSHQNIPNYEGGKLVRGGRRKNGKRKTNGRRNDVQPFIRKIYQIINDEKIRSIYWTDSGDSFVINKDLFQDGFLRLDKAAKKPIQTKEFPSFVRQLNLYGFRKRREDGDHPLLNHYVHKDGFFLRGREDLLSRIVRSGANRDPTECENNYDASLDGIAGSSTKSSSATYFDHYQDFPSHAVFPPIYAPSLYPNPVLQPNWPDSSPFCATKQPAQFDQPVPNWVKNDQISADDYLTRSEPRSGSRARVKVEQNA